MSALLLAVVAHPGHGTTATHATEHGAFGLACAVLVIILFGAAAWAADRNG